MSEEATIWTDTGPRVAQATSIEDIGSDSSLWKSLDAEQDIAAFARAWLAILSRSQPAIVQAALLHSPAGTGPYVPIGQWSKSPSTDAEIQRFASGTASILNAVLQSHHAAIDAVDGTATSKFAGVPIAIDGRLCGIVLVEAIVLDASAARRLMRHLQWGSAWVEAFLRRAAVTDGAEKLGRAKILIEFVNSVLAEPGYRSAARMFVARLSDILRCERVSFGQRNRHESRIVAVLHASSFERKLELGRSIEAAMNEAIDQQMALVAPASAETTYVAAAQENLVRQNNGAGVMTVPVLHGGHPVGAVTLERFSGQTFTPSELELCEALCAVAGPILMDKREKDWSIVTIAAARLARVAQMIVGPQYFYYKVAAVVAFVVGVYLLFATDTYRVSAHAQLQGEVRRVINAPFDGYIRAQYARAGQIVHEGDVLAELQDNDLTLDRLRHVAQRRQYQLELDRALSKRDLAQANIARSQIEQKEAEIELTDQMLSRTQIRAPFDSVIVSGDLSQAIGRPVSRGDVLFELAPLDRYRVALIIPETDVQALHAGDKGQVLLTALPEQTFRFEVTTITPIARTADGVNGFEALAALRDRDPRMRPSMEGVAKIDVGERSVVWIWTHGLFSWLRVKIWSFLP